MYRFAWRSLQMARANNENVCAQNSKRAHALHSVSIKHIPFEACMLSSLTRAIDVRNGVVCNYVHVL